MEMHSIDRDEVRSWQRALERAMLNEFSRRATRRNYRWSVNVHRRRRKNIAIRRGRRAGRIMETRVSSNNFIPGKFRATVRYKARHEESRNKE